MSQRPPLTINHEHVNLVTVDGDLDRDGMLDLQKQLDLLLDGGARFVVVDLSQAVEKDGRLSSMIDSTAGLLRYRGGWLRLVGPGDSLPAAPLMASTPASP